MKNSTTASTRASLSTDHGSSRRNCSAAWRGGLVRVARAQPPVSLAADVPPLSRAGGGMKPGASRKAVGPSSSRLSALEATGASLLSWPGIRRHGGGWAAAGPGAGTADTGSSVGAAGVESAAGSGSLPSFDGDDPDGVGTRSLVVAVASVVRGSSASEAGASEATMSAPVTAVPSSGVAGPVPAAAGSATASPARPLPALPSPLCSGVCCPVATDPRSGSAGVLLVLLTRWSSPGSLSGVPGSGSARRICGGGLRIVLDVARDGQQRGGLTQVHQADPLRLSTGLPDLAGGGPDHTSGGGDRVQLVVESDDERSHQRATPAVVLERQHALPAPTLHRVVLDRGALGIPARGGHQHEPVGLDHGEREQPVAGVETHPEHAGRRAAHRAQRLIAGVEPDRLALGGDQQQVVGRRAQHGADELVVFAEVDADEAAGAVRVEVGEPRLLDQTGAGGQDQVRGRLVVLDLHDLGDVLVRLQCQQVRHVLAAGAAVRLGQLVGLEPVHPALGGEEQDPVVRRADEEVRDDVVLLELRALDTLAAALLRPVEVGLGPLRVPGLGYRHDDVFDRDEVFVRDVAVVRDDLRAPLVAVLLDDLDQLVADDLPLPLRPGEDVLQIRDLALDLGQLVDDLLALQRREAPELHVEDRLGLDLVDVEQVDQAGPGDVHRRRGTDQRDDLVQRVERLDVAAQDVGALLGLAQPVARAPDDDLDLVADVVAHHLVEPQRARHPVDDGEHVDAEAVLQLRVLVEVVQHDLGHGVALERDHNAHADAVAGLVVDLGDARELAVAHQRGDRLDEVVRVDLVRQFGDDEDRPALGVVLDLDDRAHPHRAAARAVGLLDAVAPDDQPGGREVGALDALHQRGEQLLVVRLGVLQRPDDARTDLAQVVRRDVGGHADRDARAAVDQHVRHAGRQDDRLLGLAVVVGEEVDGVLV